jgi:hypothetical protein
MAFLTDSGHPGTAQRKYMYDMPDAIRKAYYRLSLKIGFALG